MVTLEMSILSHNFFSRDAQSLAKALLGKVIWVRHVEQYRDPPHLYRFIDFDMARYSTQNPLTKRGWWVGEHYYVQPYAA